jgi:hypothetical protein
VADAGDFTASGELDWLEQYAERQQAEAERTIATIPALSLAVQAFLFSIGLGPNTSGAGRVAVAIVGLVSAVFTYLATARQEGRRGTYSRALHKHRAHRGAKSIGYETLRERYNPAQPSLRTRTTINIWLAMVGVFVLLDVFVFVAGVLELTGVTDILSG